MSGKMEVTHWDLGLYMLPVGDLILVERVCVLG